MELPYGEDMNYWKTGKSQPDKWLDNAEDIIERHGGVVTLRAKGKHGDNAAFCMDFRFDPNNFRAVWPILPSRNGDIRAAERQAATMLFYDIKSRALKIAIFGARTAFFDFLLLGDGRTAGQISNQNLLDYSPKLLQ